MGFCPYRYQKLSTGRCCTIYAVADNLFDIVVKDPIANKTLMSTPNMPVGVTEHFIGLHASALVKDGGTLQIGIGALGDALTFSDKLI